MSKFILGRKLNMTQKFLADGRVAPVTIVEAGPCTIVQVKGQAEGYQAVQVGFGYRKKVSRPLAGHVKNLGNFRYLREFRLDDASQFSSGQSFDVTSFKVGDRLKVTAVSKGKGFQGVVKRHGFAGSPASHGHKDQLRMPGSIGSTEPQHVFKGTRMAGRMGTDVTTVKNLELVEIDIDKNLLYIKGAVPGSRNALVKIIATGDLVLMIKESIPQVSTMTANDQTMATRETNIDNQAAIATAGQSEAKNIEKTEAEAVGNQEKEAETEKSADQQV